MNTKKLLFFLALLVILTACAPVISAEHQQNLQVWDGYYVFELGVDACPNTMTIAVGDKKVDAILIAGFPEGFAVNTGNVSYRVTDGVLTTHDNDTEEDFPLEQGYVITEKNTGIMNCNGSNGVWHYDIGQLKVEIVFNHNKNIYSLSQPLPFAPLVFIDVYRY